MKSIKFLSFLFMVLIAFGCSKDDDGVESYHYSKNNLTGTYSITYYQTKIVETVDVNGFDVTTTTTSTGDTFNITATFDSNDILTLDGTYRVVEVKTQSGQSTENPYIVVKDDEKMSYSVKENTSELTFDNRTYKVSDFGRTGFKIQREKTTVADNGDTTVYTENWTFSK